jgi:hypothetical protein
MEHLHRAVVLFVTLATLVCHAGGAYAQQSAAPVITGTRVAPGAGTYHGPLYVTVAGKERRIAADAIAAWIIDSGRKVVYSGRDGAGGYENEGQSLRVYDARTRRHRKIMAAHFEVDDVTEVTVGGNKTALLVVLSDSGLGASYLAVVDPTRGEVFFRRWVRLESREGDVIVIGHYTEDDWGRLSEDPNAAVKPYKTERHDLRTILRGRGSVRGTVPTKVVPSN